MCIVLNLIKSILLEFSKTIKILVILLIHTGNLSGTVTKTVELLKKHPVGNLLSKITDVEDAINSYIDDFIEMVYSSRTPKEYLVIYQHLAKSLSVLYTGEICSRLFHMNFT